MPTAASIDSKVSEAVTAIESGDWDTAMTKLIAAEALLAVKPDTRNGRTEIEYSEQRIRNLMVTVRRQQNAAKFAAGGIQRTNVKYAAPADTPAETD